MTYEETIQYLYESAPLFQNIGAGAYKEGLQTTELLDAHFGHPHRSYRSIHVAGTNGKGSCAYTLAAILQSAGYKVGLYTSPHLLDFRERIRVNGEKIPRDYVVDFVENERTFFEPLHPSFFEITTAMAFRFFCDAKVDVAVIEVGLGGRLDCTNIIRPELSVITNIGFDHTHFLGNTLEKIAAEKAGIIKPSTPVLIGEYTAETRPVFEEKARAQASPIVFAADEPIVLSSEEDFQRHGRLYTTRDGIFFGELAGIYQEKNTNTILHAVRMLRSQGFRIMPDHVNAGFAHVCTLTGLSGRWQVIAEKPYVVCDTAHNPDGFRTIAAHLSRQHYDKLRLVLGMVSDKDVEGVLKLLPADGIYYFTQPDVARALSADALSERAANCGLSGRLFATVGEAYEEALREASPEDMIYVGGSNFVIADFLKHLHD